MAEIAVLVIDPGSRKHAQLIEANRPVRDLIPVLVRRLRMPDDLNYQIIPAATGRAVPVNFTPTQAGIVAGSEVQLSPVQDDVFDAILRRIYKEAKNYVRDRLWDLAREKLEELHRVDPQYPDSAGIVQVVYNRTVEPRSFDAGPRDRPRGRPRRRNLDYGRNAAVPSASTAASGASVFGKLIGFTMCCGMIAAGGYAAWQDPAARGWMKRQIAQVTGKPAASGDVLAALRETGTEQGWKNEVCEELPKEKLKEMVAAFDANMKTVNVRTYMLGDRKKGSLEGIPMCNRTILVGEYDDEAMAKQFMDNTYKGLDSMHPGQVSHVKIANCDDCIRLSHKTADFDMSRSFARKGRRVFMYDSGVEEPTIGTDRMEAIFSSLGKRLAAK